MAEAITFQVADEKVRALARRVPALRKIVGDRIVHLVVRKGVAEIVGGTLKANGVNRLHARYFSASMLANISDDGTTITTGLLAAEEEARILAHRETGGTIFPKPDRPNPHLRIPLPPALTPDGFERGDNTGKVFRLRDYKTSPFRLQPIKAGGALLIHKASNVPWYVLKRSVTQRPHPWWTKAAAAARVELDATIAAALAQWESKQSAAKGGTP